MNFTSWESEIYCSGIKGQRKGVRRFQNYDGTLTEEGKLRYRKTLPERAGYTPLKGKNGDYVQQTIANEQLKLEKKHDKLMAKRDKRLAKDNGVESTRSQKLLQKAESALMGAQFRKEMQTAYSKMALSDRKKIKVSMIISDVGKALSPLVGGAIGGAVFGGLEGYAKSRLISATDKEHGYERYRGINKK